MPSQLLVFGAVRVVQVAPSGEVMMVEVPLPPPTAANRPSCGDQATPCQVAAADAVCSVQSMPSGAVLTWPPMAVATNLPSSGDQQQSTNTLASGPLYLVQVAIACAAAVEENVMSVDAGPV